MDHLIQKFNKFAEKLTTYVSMQQDCTKTVDGLYYNDTYSLNTINVYKTSLQD